MTCEHNVPANDFCPACGRVVHEDEFERLLRGGHLVKAAETILGDLTTTVSNPSEERWRRFIEECGASGTDVHKAIAAAMFATPYSEVTDEQRDTSKRRLWARLYGVSPLSGEIAPELQQLADDARGTEPPGAREVERLAEIQARADAIEKLRERLPPGKVSRAALPLTLADETTVIDIPPDGGRPRLILGIGFRPPVEAVHAALMGDCVVRIFVGDSMHFSAPLTFCTRLGQDEDGKLVVDCRQIRPPLHIERDVGVRIEIAAFCTLPIGGIGLVLHLDLLAPETTS